MFTKKKFVYVSLFLIIVFVFFLFLSYGKTGKIDSKIKTKINVDIDKNTLLGCTRKTRLNNQPQYDRALSLIQQRLFTNQKRFKYNNRALFTYFNPSLTNCIKIIENDSVKTKDVEGYFSFDNKDIKDNYYPIVVNSKYIQADDLLISLLLVHEMTHVQQYINTVNKAESYSCIDGEVDAFLASRLFYISGLNEEEMNVVSLRINEAIDNNKVDSLQKFDRPFDGQLLMLNAIQDLHNSPLLNCEKVNNPAADEESWDKFGKYLECVDKEVPIQFRKIIENDSYYKKQCNL